MVLAPIGTRVPSKGWVPDLLQQRKGFKLAPSLGGRFHKSNFKSFKKRLRL